MLQKYLEKVTSIFFYLFKTNIGSLLNVFRKFLLLLLRLFTLPQSRTYTPGMYNPNARGSDACRGNNSLWTRTLDRYMRASLPECVVSTVSGPQPKTTHPIPGQKLKFLTHPGIEPGPPGVKATPRRRMYL